MQRIYRLIKSTYGRESQDDFDSLQELAREAYWAVEDNHWAPVEVRQVDAPGQHIKLWGLSDSHDDLFELGGICPETGNSMKKSTRTRKTWNN